MSEGREQRAVLPEARQQRALLPEALIVGGGPAGAALATLLARAGRSVTVLERTSGASDKLCGEFVSGECARYLRGLGVDLAALGAVPLSRVRVAAGDVVAEGPLPFVGESLSRRVLDEALLARAVAAGAEVRRGVRVRNVEVGACGTMARLDGGAVVEAGTTFLATGKHDLRGWPRAAGPQSDLMAFKLHYRLGSDQAGALRDHVELHLFAGGYAGLSPIEEGKANLCLVVQKHHFTAVGQRWDALLPWILERAPVLAARLAGAQPCWERPLSLSRIPYGLVQRRADGLWRLGDQAAVIPSFSGDGMAIALHSAHLAARTWQAGGDADAFQRALATQLGAQLRLATPLSRALVHGPLQRPFASIARRWPSILGWLARATRVPEGALEPQVDAGRPYDRHAPAVHATVPSSAP